MWSIYCGWHTLHATECSNAYYTKLYVMVILMHIGLIDVDGHNFPNLCLMKLSAYHKLQGDSVDWYSTSVKNV